MFSSSALNLVPDNLTNRHSPVVIGGVIPISLSNRKPLPKPGRKHSPLLQKEKWVPVYAGHNWEFTLCRGGLHLAPAAFVLVHLSFGIITIIFLFSFLFFDFLFWNNHCFLLVCAASLSFVRKKQHFRTIIWHWQFV